MIEKGKTARQAGGIANNLSEYESARLLAGYGIPTAKAILAHDLREVVGAGNTIGYPVVLKLSSAAISHKTEKGLVEVDLRGELELEIAFTRLREAAADGNAEYLVQELVRGGRELAVGMVRDPQFGPCVMFGLGGIFTEVLADVVFRPAPLGEGDAAGMLQQIKGQKILAPVRGMPAVNRDSLINCLVTVGNIGLEREEVMAIDINPLIVRGSEPVAVDALVVLR
jgi:acetyl-CoA synthetase (ADP-forming)